MRPCEFKLSIITPQMLYKILYQPDFNQLSLYLVLHVISRFWLICIGASLSPQFCKGLSCSYFT